MAASCGCLGCCWSPSFFWHNLPSGTQRGIGLLTRQAAASSLKRKQTTASAPDHSCQARAALAATPALQLVQRVSPGHLAALQNVLPSKGDGNGRLCPILTVQGTTITVLRLPGWAGAVGLLALSRLVGCLVPELGLGLRDDGFPLGLERCDASVPVCRRTQREMGLPKPVQLLVSVWSCRTALGLSLSLELGAMGCCAAWSAAMPESQSAGRQRGSS